MIRDIRRKIAGKEALKERFATLLVLAHRVRFQDHRQRGHKVYALHAPEAECIGKGKARVPYEFGCKVSIATPATKPKGGQFVLHAKALHGNPFDGHTLGPVIADLEKLTGIETRPIHVDKGYRGHHHREKFRAWITGAAPDPCCNTSGNPNLFLTSDRNDRRWRFGVAQAFRITPDVAIVLQVQRDIVSSNLSLYAYTSNSVLVGPQIRF